MESFAETLRAARLSRGMSQADLGRRIGWPQSYISKLESGRLDPHLSTVIEVARSLDLEVQLVPKAILPVLDSLERTSQSSAERAKRINLVQQLRQTIFTLTRLAEQGDHTSMQRAFQEFSGYFTDVVIPPAAMRLAQITAQSLTSLVHQVTHQASSEEDGLIELKKAVQALRRLRRQMDQVPDFSLNRTRDLPAYAYDEDDDD